MAAAGGHWIKITTGDLVGKRVFVPKNWTEEAAYYAKKQGWKPGQINAEVKAETKKASKMVSGGLLKAVEQGIFVEKTAGLEEQKPAPKTAKKTSAPKAPKAAGPDLFNPAGGAASQPAPKVASTKKTSFTAPGYKKAETYQPITTESKGNKPLKFPKKDYVAVILANQDAWRFSAYHKQNVVTYKDATDSSWKVALKSILPTLKLAAGSNYYEWSAKYNAKQDTYSIKGSKFSPKVKARA